MARTARIQVYSNAMSRRTFSPLEYAGPVTAVLATILFGAWLVTASLNRERQRRPEPVSAPEYRLPSGITR